MERAFFLRGPRVPLQYLLFLLHVLIRQEITTSPAALMMTFLFVFLNSYVFIQPV
jgi:K+-sensing histidine kinase KdpD